MTENFISVLTENQVATITVRRMPSSWDELETFQPRLEDVFNEMDADNSVRVVLFHGAGPDAFDTDMQKLLKSVRGDGPMACLKASVTEPVDMARKPVIGVFEGAVNGIGLELALCCDVRLAATSASFCMSHTRFGLIPWEGGTQRLSRIVGQARALELALVGETLDAGTARQIGLIHRLVDSSENTRDAALSLALKMAEKSPVSTTFVKEAIKSGMDLPLSHGIRLEADLYFLMHSTHDRTEGIRAFLEKRPPQFNGE